MSYSKGPQEPSNVKSSDLTYGQYLKIPELLNLQKPLSEQVHTDELLFIVIHQVYELWFKVILTELERAQLQMRDLQVLKAHHLVHRCVEIMKVLAQQIHILETMTSVDFLAFRDKLQLASGFQSLQFREVEFLLGLKDATYLRFFLDRPEMVATLKKRLAEPDIATDYYEMLRHLGFNLPADTRRIELEGSESERQKVYKVLDPLFRNYENYLPLYLLTESLVELDEYLSIWRFHHAKAIERVIGSRAGTGGSAGVKYLEATFPKRVFHLLWEIRSHLTKTDMSP
jgi:tryptophan 2,3-dioxygenase